MRPCQRGEVDMTDTRAIYGFRSQYHDALALAVRIGTVH
jgi:hypothetical protein